MTPSSTRSVTLIVLEAAESASVNGTPKKSRGVRVSSVTENVVGTEICGGEGASNRSVTLTVIVFSADRLGEPPSLAMTTN